jgi:GNAT superfamily N-acetyltransferase
MSVQLRKIVSEDAKRLAVLLGHLGYPTGESAVRERLRGWQDDPASHLLGAEADGVLIGVAALHTMPMLEMDGRLGRLLALVVDEDHRGRGVGELLVTAAEQLARDAGCGRMEITSSRRRTRTHEFYQRLGYEDRCPVSARFLKTL